MSRNSIRRRSLLVCALGAGAASISGCLDGTNADDDADTGDESAETDPDDPGSSDDETPSDDSSGSAGGRDGGESGGESGRDDADDERGHDEAVDSDEGDDEVADSESDNDDDGEDADEDVTYAVDDAVSMTVELDGEETQAVAPGDVETVSDVQYMELFGLHYVSMALTDAGIETFAETLESTGAIDDPSKAEIHTYREDERLHTSSFSSDLAEAVESERFDGSFNSSFDSEENAERYVDALTTD